MAPSKRTKPTGTSKKSTSKLSTLSLDSIPAGPKHTSSLAPPSLRGTRAPKVSMPLTSLSKPISLGAMAKSLPSSSKGKAPMALNDDDQLWVDKYAPQTEADLAVHKKKIVDVRRWFEEAFDGGPTGVLRKYRRILALTGPAGSGKTAVLQVLARELEFEIVEWQNAMNDNFSTEDEYDRETLTSKFETFFARASSCRTLPLWSSTASSSSSSSAPSNSRQIMLFEDIPNVLQPGIGDSFRDALEGYIDSPPCVPLVFIVSDAGTRGEDSESDMLGSGRRGKQVIDVRSIVHPQLFNSPYFTEIRFNPIASTLLSKALTNLLTQHFRSTSSKNRLSAQQPAKEVVQLVVESSHGDIRSAIMGLQFACVVRLPKGKNMSARSILEAVTRREQSLALFHMLGKVLYNKRKGDPPNPSATAKDREREERLDCKIPDPPDLPPHLEEHARRGSRVDVNTLYADSPIDTSLFSLYLHQNYTQFCDEVDECDAVCEWLSWIDANVSETWQARQNPHNFHILALGTLHGLPSPVSRRSQKMFKPDFFEVLTKSKAAEDGVADTEAWLNAAIETEVEGSRRWGRDELVLEIGGVLKALDASGSGGPPSTHGLFTTLTFVHPAIMPSLSQRMNQLGETETPGSTNDNDPGAGSAWTQKGLGKEHPGGWLESDDIEDF